MTSKDIELIGSQTMTSKEIAELTKKRPADVMRDIRNMESAYLEAFNTKRKFAFSEYKDKTGRKLPMFNLTKSQALFIVSGYSHVVRGRIQARWEELETKYQKEQSRIASRQMARLENPDMTNALRIHRLDEGKETKPFHYSNENNLIYLVVLGATAKKYKKALDIKDEENLRDNLTALQIEAVEKIQKMNTTLIDLGIEYKERKQKLNKFYEKRLSNAIMNEFHKLNA